MTCFSPCTSTTKRFVATYGINAMYIHSFIHSLNSSRKSGIWGHAILSVLIPELTSSVDKNSSFLILIFIVWTRTLMVFTLYWEVISQALHSRVNTDLYICHMCALLKIAFDKTNKLESCNFSEGLKEAYSLRLTITNLPSTWSMKEKQSGCVFLWRFY